MKDKKEAVGGRGLGNEFQIFIAAADSLELGRFRFREPRGSTGGMKIGGGFLRNFTVTFDYPDRRLFLQPNNRYRDGGQLRGPAPPGGVRGGFGGCGGRY